MPPLTVRQSMFFDRPFGRCRSVRCPSVRPSAVRPLTPISSDAISLLNGRISTKVDTNIHHVIGQRWKGLQGQ